MKHLFTTSIVAIVATASIITLSSFKAKEEKKPAASAYSIQLMSQTQSDGAAGETWTWVLTNPNPGNGDNGTLQDVSHWSIAISPQAEAALVSAEYSYDGVTWYSVSTEVERDPAIRACTSVDVLKFNVGTSGSQPTYYRATFDQSFNINPYSTSWIKTGGGRTGCNMYTFAGISTPRVD